jgi:hypothetical protein
MRLVFRFVAVTCLVALTIAQASVHADVFAVVNVAAPAPRLDLDIAIVNAAGKRLLLPSVVNTSAFELYPSISSDGRRLLFRRLGGSDGQRLLMVDVTTGALAEIFSPAEIASRPLFNSSLSSDGNRVYSGRSLRQISSGYIPVVTTTFVHEFPTGTFAKSDSTFPVVFPRPGSVTNVAMSKQGYALRILPTTGPGQLLVRLNLQTAPFKLSDPAIDYGAAAFRELPFLSMPFVIFEQRPVLGFNTFGTSDLAVLPPIQNPSRLFATTGDESQPAVTSDGRYLGFVHHGTDGHDRLFVFDTVTGTYLNPGGVDLGLTATRGIGAVSLYQKEVITSSLISRTGTVTAALADASGVGILVQRIVSEIRDRASIQYELEMVGRVPLGSFEPGHLSAQWDLAVDGQPLPPGRYLVTLRAVEDNVVRELGKPHVIRVR